jgi:hypothetical protein
MRGRLGYGLLISDKVYYIDKLNSIKQDRHGKLTEPD